MKSKKVTPKNKKTGKKIHFTKRSFMAFGVISLLALSTFGLVYNNMFNAKAFTRGVIINEQGSVLRVCASNGLYKYTLDNVGSSVSRTFYYRVGLYGLPNPGVYETVGPRTVVYRFTKAHENAAVYGRNPYGGIKFGQNWKNSYLQLGYYVPAC